MAEMQCFISWLVDGLATAVRQQISRRGRTDWRRQHNALSWFVRRRRHDATSNWCRWTDQWQRHDASSLGLLTVWLVTCNGKSACAGRLINGGDTMIFLGMINGGDTMLLLAGTGGLIGNRDTTLLLLAGRWFSYLHATANQRAQADWSTVATRCFFLLWSTAATRR